MNRGKYINWTQRNFPLSTEGLNFIQEQILLAAKYAQAAGGNYILEGCAVNGSNVAAGTVIINGELLPFKAGTLQDKVRIVQATDNITAGSETYEDAYTYRYVEFGSHIGNVDTFNWADLKAFPTNKYLAENYATSIALEEVRNLVMPKGGIIMWNGVVSTIPTGWALCDGQTVNGVTTPDLRRKFIVGFDPAAPNTPPDTNASNLPAAARLTENYGNVGNKGGKASVTLETNQLPDFALSIPGLWGRDDQNFTDTNAFTAGDQWNANFNLNLQYSRGKSAGNYGQPHENRPPYYVLAYIIKVV